MCGGGDRSHSCGMLQCVEEEIDSIPEGCYNVWKRRSIPFLRKYIILQDCPDNIFSLQDCLGNILSFQYCLDNIFSLQDCLGNILSFQYCLGNILTFQNPVCA